MNREDLLKKIKEENETSEPYEVEINRLGWKIGAIGSLVAAMLTFLLELMLWGKYNIGVYIVLLTMLSLTLTVQSVKLKSVFNLVMAIICTVLLLVLIVTYAFALNYGWV